LELVPPDEEEGEDDTKHPIARFADGSERAILSLTMKGLKLEELLKKQSRGKLWSAGDCYIVYRKDRSPILILFQEKSDKAPPVVDKQLCQICVNLFGDPDDKVIYRASSSRSRERQSHILTPPLTKTP
jgi:hypothetical protein